MTRRSPQAAIKPIVSAPSTAWPPTCGTCGEQGAPGPDWSPYIACDGDPARHQRQPVGGAA